MDAPEYLRFVSARARELYLRLLETHGADVDGDDVGAMAQQDAEREALERFIADQPRHNAPTNPHQEDPCS